MDDLLERLEAMGTTGGLISIGLAVLLTFAGVGLLVLAYGGPSDITLLYALETTEGTAGEMHVSPRFIAIGGLVAFVFAMPLGIVGARSLMAPKYPSASEVFPSMEIAEIQSALAKATETQCVCASCRVMVPAAFSTGSCPVCASSLEYHEVRSEEDARIVIAAMS